MSSKELSMKVTKEKVLRILKMQKEGLPKTTMSQRIGLSVDTIRKVLIEVEDEKGRNLQAQKF
jgi:predicted transcriptional regulator